MPTIRQLAVFGLCLLVVVTSACYLGKLPPEDYTATTMEPLKTRILRFAKANNRLPDALSDLPPLEGFTNKTTDVWGNEIRYGVSGSTITLISYGKDQKPGGSGDDRDVVGVFDSKSVDGKWVDEE